MHPAAAVSPPGTPVFVYVQIPVPCLYELYDTPLAIGLYALIARRFAITGAPVPLSASDVQRYDPTLKYGAVVRALTRLVARGWVQETTHPGMKSCYVPTWGRIKGTSRPWQMDTPRLNRPRHIHTRRLDVRLLDTYMGRLVPHATRKAVITRYLTRPLLRLRDIGTYALALVDIPGTTAPLQHYQLLRGGQAQPLPTDATILAQASQQTLEHPDGPALTAAGLRKLRGTGTTSPAPAPDAPFLFFVPRELIGDLVGSLTGTLVGGVIGQADAAPAPASALGRAQTDADAARPTIPCTESRISNESSHPTSVAGMVGDTQVCQEPAPEPLPSDQNPEAQTSTPITLQNEAAQLLQDLQIHPPVIRELADLPVDQIQEVLQEARSRPGVRDPAGWVVARLRAQRDTAARSTASCESAADTPPPAAARPAGDGVDLHRRSARSRCRDAAEPGAGQPAVAPPAEGRPAMDRLDAMMPTPAPILVPVPDGDLSDQVRPELHVRLPHRLWPVVERLTITSTAQQLVLICPQAADRAVVASVVMPILESVCTSLGWRGPSGVHLLIRATTAPPPAPPPVDQEVRPAWIAPAVWADLPSLARIALRGATRVDGQVCGATPAMDRVLQTRFADVVRALQRIDQAGASEHPAAGAVMGSLPAADQTTASSP